MKESTKNMIDSELEKAREKLPFWPEDVIHGAAILGEEAGEVIKAALQYRYEGGKREEIFKEAIQTAAMAIRLLENG